MNHKALPQLHGPDLIAAKLATGNGVTISLARLTIDALGRLRLPETWQESVVESNPGQPAGRDWVAVGTTDPTGSAEAVSVRESVRSDSPRARW